MDIHFSLRDVLYIKLHPLVMGMGLNKYTSGIGGVASKYT